MKQIIKALFVAAIATVAGCDSKGDSPNGEALALKLYGNVDIRQVSLGFRTGGRIANMHFEEGDSVAKGSILALLDGGPLEDALALYQARAGVAEATVAKLEAGTRPGEIALAKTIVEERQITLDGIAEALAQQVKLARSGAVSRQAADDIKARHDEAATRLESARKTLALAEEGPRAEDIAIGQAELEAARVQVAVAERKLKDTELASPADGIILTRVQEPGAIVGPGSPVYTLSLKSPVWVRTYISGPDLGRINPGMKMEVFTDSNPGKPYEDQIGFISPVAEFTPKSVETEDLRTDLVYRVRVIIKNLTKDCARGCLSRFDFPMPEPLVSIKGVSKSFPKSTAPALNNISGEIRAGEIYGLVGPDGAGKTTLLRLMAGLLEPSEGTITVTGLDSVAKADLIHERTGYMPQRFSLYEELTVKENLCLYADLRSVVGEERGRTFDRLLQFTTRSATGVSASPTEPPRQQPSGLSARTAAW